MNEYVPRLISNGGTLLSPILRDPDQLRTVDELHTVPVDGAGIAGLAVETLPRKTLDVLVADPQPVVLAGVTALLARDERVENRRRGTQRPRGGRPIPCDRTGCGHLRGANAAARRH